MKLWLQNHDREMYSAHNEENSSVAESFITTLINKIFKYMTLTQKTIYTDNLHDILYEYNNTFHRTDNNY